jgi:hypothetical protein
MADYETAASSCKPCGNLDMTEKGCNFAARRKTRVIWAKTS